MYETREEASNRLLNTIVTYDGKPAQVTDTTEITAGVIALQLRLWPFGGGAAGRRVAELTDPLLSFRTPPLGFANYFDNGNTHALWVERTPARRMQQGLINGNVGISALRGGFRVNLDGLKTSDAFREMIAGEYPSFEDVLGILVPESSIAFDRNYALLMGEDETVAIYHRRQRLGLIISRQLYLRSDCAYAREALVENERIPCEVLSL